VPTKAEQPKVPARVCVACLQFEKWRSKNKIRNKVKYGEESGEREAKNADSKRWCSDTLWIIYLDYYPAIGLYMYTRRPPRCQLTGWIISGLKIGFRGKWQAFANTAHDRQLLRSPRSLFSPPLLWPPLCWPQQVRISIGHTTID